MILVVSSKWGPGWSCNVTQSDCRSCPFSRVIGSICLTLLACWMHPVCNHWWTFKIDWDSENLRISHVGTGQLQTWSSNCNAFLVTSTISMIFRFAGLNSWVHYPLMSAGSWLLWPMRCSTWRTILLHELSNSEDNSNQSFEVMSWPLSMSNVLYCHLARKDQTGKYINPVISRVFLTLK